MVSPSNLEQLHAAAIDGRTENVRYRQDELQRLHFSLRDNATIILSSISKDSIGGSSASSVESEAEYWLTMNAVERQYEALDFEVSLKQEYLIATGANNENRRIGKGLVVIRPTTHTRFYSVIVPLATAIAAGNCIALELTDTTLNVDAVLKDLLPKALDIDTFRILNTIVSDSSIAFLVDQTTSNTECTLNQLSSNSSARAVAIVDRSANIEAAAKAIVTARFSFQGTSPYSPDLIIVNDFIKNEFSEACSRYAGRFFPLRSKTVRAHNNSTIATHDALRAAEEKGQVSTSGSGVFRIVDIHDRASLITKMKISGYYLPIVESTSLVDSININKSSDDLLALYTFSDLATAKFLSQHLPALTSHANSIPSHLLVGPARPITSLPAPLYHRYSSDMFSSPRPQYAVMPSSPPHDLSLIDGVLSAFGQPSAQSTIALQTLRGEITRDYGEGGKKKLELRKARPKGSQIGFFEQGIFSGAALLSTAVASAILVGGWVVRRLI